MTQVVKSPSRGLWLVLSPVLLIGVFARGLRMMNSATGPGGSLSAAELESQPADKVEYVNAATQKQLEATVAGQLAALRQQDWAGALRFTDASLQRSYTQGKFQETVQQSGFAVMLASSRQECRKALRANRLTTMLVTVRKPDGDGAGFVYRLVSEGNEWRIASCTHALDPDIAAFPTAEMMRAAAEAE